MPKYEYRALNLDTGGDFYSDHREHKRRDDKKPLRCYWATDSGRPELQRLSDELGDDYWAFRNRAIVAFVDYLNALGSECWKLVSFTPTSLGWPVGGHLFMREVE